MEKISPDVSKDLSRTINTIKQQIYKHEEDANKNFKFKN